MRLIADWIGAFARLLNQFVGARNELPGDGIILIVGVDQRGNIGSHRNRVAGCDPFKVAKARGRRQAMLDQFGRLAQRRG
jgi:hypothetical protein